MKLTESEKYLIRFIENHSSKISELSITELSDLANVSTATIVRAVKKLGFKGFTDYKLSLKDNIKDSTFLDLLNDGQEIKNIITKNQQEVINTIQNLNIELIDDTLQYINSAEVIYLYARGLSEQIGSEMEMKFHLLNKRAELYTDPNIIRIISHRANNKDICIIISLSGETQELIDAARTLHDRDTTIILISANSSSPLRELSDISLLGYKSKTSNFPEYEVRSRLPLHIISRIILDAYANRYSNRVGD